MVECQNCQSPSTEVLVLAYWRYSRVRDLSVALGAGRTVGPLGISFSVGTGSRCERRC